MRRRSRSSRSTRASRCRSSSASSRRRAGGGSCSRPTSPRPRSPCPASATSSTRGLARVKRYSLRNKTTLLQIEKISQAAADQRAGRCGRVGRRHLRAPLRRGRLRGAAEIHRSRDPAELARRGDPADGGARRSATSRRFRSSSRRGRARSPTASSCCTSWARSTPRRRLTPLGRELARLPVDPRVGRMVLAAREHGCVAEMLVIASALSVPDPRERPLAKQQAADQAHLLFRDDRSDFLSLLALWQFFDAKLAREAHAPQGWWTRAARTSSPTCASREWRDVHAQLASEVAEQGCAVDARVAGDDRRREVPVDPRGAARGPHRQHRHAWTATPKATPARAASASSCTPARASRRRSRNGCWRPSSSKRRGSSRAARRGSSPSGSRRSRASA